VQTVREPLLVLTGDLHIVTANRAFSRLIGIGQDELPGRLLSDIGGSLFAQSRLRAALETVVTQGQPVEDYELSHDVPAVGLRLFQLNARRLEEIGAKAARVLVVLHETSTTINLPRV
jgi:two-component system CheB/CheR fusion protein